MFRRPVQHVSPFGRGRVGTLGRVLCVTMKPLGALRPGQAVDPPGGGARVSSGPGETNLAIFMYLVACLLTYLLSHSRGTPLSHPHCPVGQLRSRVVGPEYVGHRWWGQGGGKVGRGGGGGYYYSTLQAVSLSASLSPHLCLSSSSWLPLACSPHSTPAHPAFVFLRRCGRSGPVEPSLRTGDRSRAG